MHQQPYAALVTSGSRRMMDAKGRDCGFRLAELGLKRNDSKGLHVVLMLEVLDLDGLNY